MKKLWYISGLLGLLFIGHHFYGMQKGKRGAVETPLVEVLFTPKNIVYDKLAMLMDNANKRILLAMYWITDDSVLDNLIRLKKGNKDINVEVIFDESTTNPSYLVKKLSDNGIIPLVYPSQIAKGDGSGLMHNKFVVIDDTDVFTGSANLTGAGLNIAKIANHENVIIIHSNEIAQQYLETFDSIQNETLRWYIKILANTDELPEWLQELLKWLPKTVLISARNTLWKTFTSSQRDRLQRFFGEQIEQEATSTQTPTLDLPL